MAIMKLSKFEKQESLAVKMREIQAVAERKED